MAKNHRASIETPVGVVNGRDSIYLDSVIHTGDLSMLTFTGELNANLCSKYEGSGKWIVFELKFLHVPCFRGWEIDVYPSELEIQSSFDLIEDSAFLQGVSALKHDHYVLSTYDYIYEILAKDFVLNLGSERG